MDHADLIDRFYRAYASRDAEEAASLYHPDGWHEEVAMAKRREGHAALAEGLVGFWRMLPDVSWDRRGYVRAGNSVAVPYHMTGTFTPRGEGAAPRLIALDGLHLFEFRDGLLAGTRDMWDLDLFKAQMS
ncbi:nuclear transport factor 2 family protein [Sinorhizobium sp. BG8]|uniref:nuclear transport factor 2 family protein n=1 Tax=Sinorhizobium sp. BG8 TaxID=2613773 RepID=UPI00193CE3BE|nr:nuclear transport factor 2 family protein [Sinorhizobium sp. BG8]QRM53278.1 nuclear transport factor 2 family protein [Sinorhizobium sp. BG8]